MHIHELKREIHSLEEKTTDLGNMIKTIKNNGNSLPLGRPIDSDGAEKYDEPDGTGYYKAWGEGSNAYSVGNGDYMKMSDEPYIFPQKVIHKYEEAYQKGIKNLEKMRRQLVVVERKVAKNPAVEKQQIDDKPIDGKVAPDSTREQLESQLSEIEKNHAFIRDNTALVAQSNSLLGKIKKFLGDKRILGFGDIQKRAEEIEKAIAKEQKFITSRSSKTYEEALNTFKYGSKQGPKTIKVVEHVGPHGDYTKTVNEVTLKPFDHICDEVGKQLFEKGVIDKDIYEVLVAKWAKTKETSLVENLQSQVKNEITVGNGEELEDLSTTLTPRNIGDESPEEQEI